MQWNKAKTIMIALFLLLNIALAYLNFTRSSLRFGDNEGDEQVQQSALMRLEQSGLRLQQEPLHYAEDMSTLLLAEQNCLGTPQQIAQTLFGSQGFQEDHWRTLSGGEQWRFRNEDATLEVSSDGRWVYRLNGAVVGTDSATGLAILSYEEALEVAESFVERYNLMPKLDTRLTGVPSPEQRQYDFAWQRVYRGYTLFDSEIVVSVCDGEVIMVYSSLRDIRDETASRMRTCNSSDILFRLSQDADLLALAQERQAEGLSLDIDTIELGFFSAYAAKDAEEELLAQPTWRIRLSGGRDIFYSALNGQRVYP